MTSSARENTPSAVASMDQAGELLYPEAIVGRYTLVERLAQGGMGEVWLARTTKGGLIYVLKFILKHVATDQKMDASSRFKLEAQVLADGQCSSLATDHLIRLIDSFRTPEGLLCMVLPYLKGHSLYDVMAGKTKIKLTMRDVITIGMQVARALIPIHDDGRVHRDIKPLNIFLEYDEYTGLIKATVIDPGLARVQTHLSADEKRMTAPGQLCGTDMYLPADYLLSGGESCVDVLDIFSLGVTLFRLLCDGRHPFDETGNDAGTKIVGRIMRDMRVPIPAFEALPDPIKELINSMLACNPDDRPSAKVGTRRMAALLTNEALWREAEMETLSGTDLLSVLPPQAPPPLPSQATRHIAPQAPPPVQIWEMPPLEPIHQASVHRSGSGGMKVFMRNVPLWVHVGLVAILVLFSTISALVWVATRGSRQGQAEPVPTATALPLPPMQTASPAPPTNPASSSAHR